DFHLYQSNIHLFQHQLLYPYNDIKLKLSTQSDEETGMVTDVKIRILLPDDFPDKYKDAVISTASKCKVKKHLFEPPKFEIFI
ncbi:MAG: hypothetical protein ACFFKA_13085, partial [Candidatus Thorarchaeota archaeon]